MASIRQPGTAGIRGDKNGMVGMVSINRVVSVMGITDDVRCKYVDRLSGG